MPRTLFLLLLVALWTAFAWGAPVPAKQTVPDSARMERDMQQLPWEQFRAVIEAVPKLKADVEAYGAFGWQYVKARYATYGWKKNIDRLDDEQKRQLAALIRKAKAAGERPASRGGS